MENFILAVMEAVEKDQTSMASMQITDTHTTELAAKMEKDIYAFWNLNPDSPMVKAQKEIAKWAKKAKNKKNKNASEEVTYWQEKYSSASAQSQAQASQQEGQLTAAQGQTSADAQNLQMKAQDARGVNSLLAVTAQYLGQIIA